MNDLISGLEAPLSADTRIRDDWREISAYYGRLSPSFFFLCVASLIGIPLVAVSAYYAELWTCLVVALSLLGAVMCTTCVLVLIHFMKSRSYRSRYRKARETYIVDSLRV